MIEKKALLGTSLSYSSTPKVPFPLTPTGNHLKTGGGEAVLQKRPPEENDPVCILACLWPPDQRHFTSSQPLTCPLTRTTHQQNSKSWSFWPGCRALPLLCTTRSHGNPAVLVFTLKVVLVCASHLLHLLNSISALMLWEATTFSVRRKETTPELACGSVLVFLYSIYLLII